MKIMFLTPVLKPGFGVSLVIQKQIVGLWKMGIKSMALASPDADLAKEYFLQNKIKITSIPIDLSFDQTREAILSYRPDIAIVHSPPYYRHVGQFNDFPLIKVAYDHGEPFPSFYTNRQERMDRELIDEQTYQSMLSFNAHISISEFIKASARIPESIVIYNGADHIIEIPPLKQKFNLRKTINAEAEQYIIAGLCRIGRGESFYKGFDLQIQLKSRIDKYFGAGRVQFVFIGSSEPVGNEYEQALQEAGFHLFINIDNSKKITILQQSDIFVSTSLWEGFNLPMAEAQYLGLPSLCFTIGAHPEIAPFHFPTVDEMAQYLRYLLENPSQIEWAAKICQEYVQARFTWGKNVNQLYDYLQHIFKDPCYQIPISSRAIVSQIPQSLQEESRQVIKSHFDRQGVVADIAPAHLWLNIFKVKRKLNSNPLVSIIIPNRDQPYLLGQCVDSILNLSTYRNFEIIIVENNSIFQETARLYQTLRQHKNIRILDWTGEFNYVLVEHFGVLRSTGEQILLLNNDIKVISPDWIERLLEYSIQPEIGMVGAKLYFRDDSIQHAGVKLGLGGIAGHIYRFWPKSSWGNMGQLLYPRNFLSVTTACAMIRRSVFEEVNGFDEHLPVAFSDVDICLKIIQKGYRIVWTPWAELYHYESISRGDEDSMIKKARFKKEIEHFKEKWLDLIDLGDPYCGDL